MQQEPSAALLVYDPLFADKERLALAGFLAGYRGTTRHAYALDLRPYVTWCADHRLALFSARRADIESYARTLEERGRTRATVARRLCTVAGFYRYAEEEGLLAVSPAVHVRRPRLDYESHAIGLDRNEVGALLVAAGLGPSVEHALISLLALNGLRVSEATGANVEVLDLEPGHRTLTILRKGGKIVTIPLAPRTARAIDLAIGERSEGPIFTAPDGTRLDRHGAARIVRRVARRAGLTKTIGPHTLRHAFITAALDAGVPLRDVQEAASHADPRNNITTIYLESENPLPCKASCPPPPGKEGGRRGLVPMCETSLVFTYDQQAHPGADGRPPLSPGKALKFLVEDPATKNRSSTWLIKTGRKHEDVYVCETESGPGFKASLHGAGGTLRVAMTSEMARARGVPRAVLREQATREPVDGWTEAPRVLVPCADLRPSSERVPDGVIRIPTSPTHSAICVLVLLEEPNSTVMKVVQGIFLLGVLRRPNGGGVWVYAQPITLNARDHERLAALRADARPSAPAAHPDLRFVGVFADDEQLCLVDLAVN